MNEAKTVITPIAQHFKLSVDNSPKEIDIEHKKINVYNILLPSSGKPYACNDLYKTI